MQSLINLVYVIWPALSIFSMQSYAYYDHNQATEMTKIPRGYFGPGGGILTESSILALLSLN